jgi:hypothetical protein
MGNISSTTSRASSETIPLMQRNQQAAPEITNSGTYKTKTLEVIESGKSAQSFFARFWQRVSNCLKKVRAVYLQLTLSTAPKTPHAPSEPDLLHDGNRRMPDGLRTLPIDPAATDKIRGAALTLCEAYQCRGEMALRVIVEENAEFFDELEISPTALSNMHIAFADAYIAHCKAYISQHLKENPDSTLPAVLFDVHQVAIHELTTDAASQYATIIGGLSDQIETLLIASDRRFMLKELKKRGELRYHEIPDDKRLDRVLGV